MHYFHSEMGLDGVEIDPKVIRIARDYFDLTDTVRVFNQDGRIFVSLGEQKYDIVIIDAYTQQIYIPFHLTTMEFFSQVKKGLSAEGVVAMNVSSAREDSPLIASISNTLRLVFGHVYRLRIPESFENLLVASGRSIDFAFPVGAVATELRGIAQYSRQSFRESPYDGRYKPLTDDWAPVEHMVDWQILKQVIR
jgi:predicted membrane-bound spermidine synthase